MRLAGLKPRWLEHNGERVAIMFLCPHCVAAGKATDWLTCFFTPAGSLPMVPVDYPVEGLQGSSGVRLLFYQALRDMGHPDPLNGAFSHVVSCKKSIVWQRHGDDFESLTITPSIDASASGHWHGFVTNGEVT